MSRRDAIDHLQDILVHMSFKCKYKNHFMKLRGIGMVNQQKGVQQETAYSAVVVNVSPSLPISSFHVSMTFLGQK